MPDTKDVRLELIQKRTTLKALGKGLKVKKVWGENVLIETVKPWTEMDEYIAKGLVVPDTHRAAREQMILPSTGIVLQLGEKLQNTDFVKPGDMVLFSKFAGTDYMIDQCPMKIVQINEILAVLEENLDVREVLADEDIAG